MSGWRPVVEAPRDRTWVLAHWGSWDGSYNPPAVVRCTPDGVWYAGEVLYTAPSEWAPLPPPVNPWWEEPAERLRAVAEDCERMAQWPDRAAEHGSDLLARAARFRRAVEVLRQAPR